MVSNGKAQFARRLAQKEGPLVGMPTLASDRPLWFGPIFSYPSSLCCLQESYE
jgi:hypothetical protein